MTTIQTKLAAFSGRGSDWATGFEAASAAFRRDGVLLLQNVFTTDKMAEFKKEYDRRWDYVRRNLNRFEEDDDGTSWFGNTQIRLLEKGRFEIYLDGGIFNTSDPKPIRDLVKAFLTGECIRYVGGLPSITGSAQGRWHRDVYSLFEDETLELMLPPIYITILVPLTDISLASGPTEFLLESHRLPEQACSTSALGLAKVGDAILFNAMVRHRGTKNTSADERKMLFIVHCKKWYNDY
jgi:ectoine hydroxylase-related dioxygenase (phytanoyl-CoA dioxygenase family)